MVFVDMYLSLLSLWFLLCFVFVIPIGLGGTPWQGKVIRALCMAGNATVFSIILGRVAFGVPDIEGPSTNRSSKTYAFLLVSLTFKT